MANPYSSQSISGYNSSPPSDDGSQTATNEISWSKHKTKLADPVKTLAEAINTELVSAFGLIFGNNITTKSTDYTIVAGDQGKFFSVTGTTTITLPDIATAGTGFAVAIVNTGSNTVTVDGNTSETINGSTTVTLQPGAGCILTTDGSTGWIGPVSLGIGQDGSGSGLDADTVDGNEASALLSRSNHTGTQTLSTISDSGNLAAEDTATVPFLESGVVQFSAGISGEFTTGSTTSWSEYTTTLVYIPSNASTLGAAAYMHRHPSFGRAAEFRVVVNGTNGSSVSNNTASYSITSESTVDVSGMSGWVTCVLQYKPNDSGGSEAEAHIKGAACRIT